MKNKYSLEYIKDNGLILLDAIGGSHAYNTNTETSDLDIRGVFICELDDFLSGNYPQQINDETNDIVFYELSRFLSLVSTNNPNILELLNTPEDCVRYKHPLFDLIVKQKESFITKQCRLSFGGYARAQLAKAAGLSKKMNWEQDKVTRKDLLDFCYVIENEKSISFKTWNNDTYEVKFCGLVNIPNARDLYAMYYDYEAEKCFSEKFDEKDREEYKKNVNKKGDPMGFGYKGLINVGDSDNLGISNQLRLSSIPKGEIPICNIIFNKDGFSQHCVDYKSYCEWLEKRNIHRYVDNKTHGQSYDSKNLLHTQRLLNMATEIGEGKGIIVRRPDREYLLSIRRGEVDLGKLIEDAEVAIVNMDSIFENSNLPDKVDPELINDLLVKIRREFYKLTSYCSC